MINRGLLMPEDERARRQAALYKVVTTHTSHTWAAILIRMLLSQIGTENTAHQTPYMEQSKLEASYNAASRRLLLFDYDVRSVLRTSYMDTDRCFFFGRFNRELSLPSSKPQAWPFLQSMPSRPWNDFLRTQRIWYTLSLAATVGSWSNI